MSEIDQHLQAISQVMPQGQHVQILHNLLEAVMVARNSREIVTALACLQKVRILSVPKLQTRDIHST